MEALHVWRMGPLNAVSQAYSSYPSALVCIQGSEEKNRNLFQNLTRFYSALNRTSYVSTIVVVAAVVNVVVVVVTVVVVCMYLGHGEKNFCFKT